MSEGNKAVYWEDETDPVERGRAVQECFEAIVNEQRSYREEMLQHIRMYRRLASSVNAITSNGLSTPLSLNIVRNMTNAVHSKISKHRVKTTMQTSGASWEMRELARNLDAYALGLTLQEQLPQKTPRAMLDAIVCGHGIMKTYADRKQKKPVFEWIFTPNLVVDFAEGELGDPAHYYEVKFIDKKRLKKLYPDKAEEIEKIAAVSATDDEFYAFKESSTSTMVRVVEALYIDPDDPKSGKLSIVAQGVELHGGDWKQGNPYSVIRWGQRNVGWHGMGLPEELKGIQIEINRLVRKIQAAFGLLANPYILADRSSAIARGQITDIPGSVILYNGKEPRIHAPQTVHAEVFAHLDRLYQRGYEIGGISQLSAQSQKPQGLESGRALLVFEDVESDRFADFHRAWDDLHVDCLRKAIRAASTISGYKVRVFGEDSFEEVDFKEDINLKETEWVIRPMATALLGETPPAQIENIDRFTKMGILGDPYDLLDQIDAPDIRAFLKRKNSSRRIIEKTVGRMLSGKGYMPPEPQDNLALAMEIANEMYQEARLNDCPADRLELVRDYMGRVKDLLDMAGGKNNVPTMGATAAPGGAPPIPGGPMPAPPPPPLAA